MTKTCRGCGRSFGAGELFCPDDGSRLSSASQARDVARGGDPLIGAVLDGRYRILRAIGEGGMGVVYEAEHVLIEKRVALKVLRDGFSRRADVVARFHQEAKSASRIGHPSIVDVSDFGDTPNGGSYIVMEMLRGEDLADTLSREYALAPARAASIVLQAARALAAAHAKGIVHRDLKPENLYLTERDGQRDFVKIVDFGVAKMSDIESLGGRRLTRTGMIFGTPEYMSPEHAGGRPLDHRVDIYALGVIFYEMLTGRVPFEGDNFMEVLRRHGNDPVPALRHTNPGVRVSAEIERVVLRALEKEVSRRYETMSELADELLACPELPRTSPGTLPAPPAWASSAPPAPPPVTSTTPIEREVAQTSLRLGRRAIGPLVAAGGAAVASALLAFLVLRPSAHTRDAPSEPSLVPSIVSVSSAAAQPPAPLPPAPLPPAPPPAAAPEPLRLTVRTIPSGARVSAPGRGELCAATPCVVEVPADQPTWLRATRGPAAASHRVTPEQGVRPILLRLRTSKAAAAGSESPAPRASSGDLKVPAVFR